MGGLGTNSLFDQKEAIPCKLATQVVLKPRTLWVQIVNTKYRFRGTLYQYEKPTKCSNIRSKIIGQEKRLTDQFMWMIESSNEVRLLHDPWLSQPSLLGLLSLIWMWIWMVEKFKTLLHQKELGKTIF